MEICQYIIFTYLAKHKTLHNSNSQSNYPEPEGLSPAADPSVQGD